MPTGELLMAAVTVETGTQIVSVLSPELRTVGVRTT